MFQKSIFLFCFYPHPSPPMKINIYWQNSSLYSARCIRIIISFMAYVSSQANVLTDMINPQNRAGGLTTANTPTAVQGVQ